MTKTFRYALLSCLLATTPLGAAFAQDALPAEAAPAADVAAPVEVAPAEAVPAPEVAPAAEAAPVAEVAPTAQAAVDITTGSGSITAPPEGKGQVVFYRPGKLLGAALTFSVREGETAVAKVGNGRYFVVVTDPGAHTYQMKGEVTDTLNMEIDAGETYFVEHGIGVGIVAGRPNLTPSDQASFEKIAGKLKLAKPVVAKN